MIDYQRLLSALVEAKVEFVVIGGVAATLHGSARLTADLDIVYGRSKENIRRMVAALGPLTPYLRGAPKGLPFHLDVETVRAGLNFTLTTDAGPLDLLGEIAGGFDYGVLRKRSIVVELFGLRCRLIDLDALIESKMAAGRPKDLEVIAELEAIREETERRKP
jgi:predicted nucleotidyltransferase